MASNCGSGITHRQVPDAGVTFYHNEYGDDGDWSIIAPAGEELTNLATNPSVELNAANWFGVGANVGTRTESTGFSGAFGYCVTDTSDTNPINVNGIGGFQYDFYNYAVLNTVRIRVMGPAGTDAFLQNLDAPIASPIVTLTGGWDELVLVQPGTIGLPVGRARFQVNASTTGTFYLDDGEITEAGQPGNQFPNPGLEVDAGGWFSADGAIGNRTTEEAFNGSYSYKIVKSFIPNPIDNQIGGYHFAAYDLGQQYGISVYVQGPPGTNVRLAIPQTGMAGDPVTLTGGWDRIDLITTSPGGTTPLPIDIVLVADSAGEFCMDAITIVQGDIVYDPFDGDTNGAAWDGPPHASTSTISSFARAYGTKVNFNGDVLFSTYQVDGHGIPPRSINTTAYAQGGGSFVHNVVDNARTITLTGTFEPCPQEIRSQRADLIRSLIYRFRAQCTQEAILCFRGVNPCGEPCTEELRIPVLYASGLERVTSDPTLERASIQFVSYTDTNFSVVGEQSVVVRNDTGVAGPVEFEIDYQGTADSWPIIEFRPGTTGQSFGLLRNLTTGNEVYFNIEAGTPFVITADQYAIFSGDPTGTRFDRIDLNGVLPTENVMNLIRHAESQISLMRLVPGLNRFTIGMSGGSDNGALVVRWITKHVSTDFAECTSDCGCC